MKCWFCNNELIWNCDYSFEDFGYEEEGIVAVLSCSNEDCNAMVECKLSLELEE